MSLKVRVKEALTSTLCLWVFDALFKIRSICCSKEMERNVMPNNLH